ncbi:ribosomal RNA small subunit methyltransferase A, partial [Pelagibacteraceae bacterium]|nr:ribosomal RNA small subunit methyltransferase A [Pelagibacteraceae bacterium]
FMFQKEVAERLEAKFNTSKYGRLSVISKWRLKIHNQFNVSKNCFYPKPKVESKILVFKPIETKSSKIIQIKTLEEITRILFSNKRKMINKAFGKLFKKSEIIAKDLRINLSSRPGELKESEFYKIAEKFENCN